METQTKMSKKTEMKKNNPFWVLAVILIFVFVILNIVMSMRTSEYNEKLSSLNTNNTVFNEKTETGKKCPDAIGGSKDAFLQVKYFYSPFCPWCAKEEPILQRMSKDYGKLIHIKWYNVNNCQDLAQQYRVSGVPTLVFSTLDNQTEYSHYGFTYEKDLIKLICDVSGGC